MWDIPKYLVDNGADINAKDDDGGTALMRASGTRILEIVRHLLTDNLETVKYLVEKGADVNSKDKDGYTALMIALENGRSERVEYLKSRGATE